MSSTIDQYTDVRRLFKKHFEVSEQRLNGSNNTRLQQYRRAAMDRLDTLKFPTRRDEEWKYTPVTRVLAPSYAGGQAGYSDSPSSAKLMNLPDALDVPVINGIPEIPTDLPEGLVILPLEAAFANEEYRPFIERWMKYWSSEETDPFIVLNAALSHHGIFIHVPRGITIDKTIHLNYTISQTYSPVAVHPQLFLLGDAQCELTIIESYCSDDSESNNPTLVNTVNRIQVGQNATVRHIKIQQERPDSFHINNTRAEQERDSVYSHYTAEIGGQLVRNNLHAIHLGEGVHTDMFGCCLASDSQHIDNHTFIDHALPHCTSKELYKNIITDSATGVFNGKVIVRQDAQKTNAYQQNSNLLLSDKAVMDSKPQLEIFADDVRCSHGATIGQLDEQAVFYLKSRGLSENDARKMLQVAFLGEVISNFPMESVREKVEQLVSLKMH